MRKTVAAEDWKLLSTDEGIHSVDGRNPSLNEVPWINAGIRIYWTTVNIDLLITDDFWISINWFSKTVENASKESLANAEFHWFFKEFNGGAFKVKSSCRSENLNYGSFFIKVDDSSRAFFTEFIANIYNFFIG